MRFLVDESLQQGVADLLANAGYDAIHLGALGMLGASDGEVLAAAAREERILVTADTDFGTLLALTGAVGPSVILLRRPGRRAGERARAILHVVDIVGESLKRGAVIVVEPDRARVRELPVERDH